MTHVDVTVPDGLLAALRKAPHEVAGEMRLAAAIHSVSTEPDLHGEGG